MAENSRSFQGTALNLGGGDMSTNPDFSDILSGDMRRQLEALQTRQTPFSALAEQFNSMEQMKIISEMVKINPSEMVEQYQTLIRYNQMISVWLQSQGASASLALLSTDVMKRSLEAASHQQQMMNSLRLNGTAKSSSYTNNVSDPHTRSPNQLVPCLVVPQPELKAKHRPKARKAPVIPINRSTARSSVSVENNTRQSTSGDSTSQYSIQPSNQIQAGIFKSDSNVDVSATMTRGLKRKDTSEIQGQSTSANPSQDKVSDSNMREFMKSLGLCTQEIKQDIISAKYHRSQQQAAPSDDSSVSQDTECSTSTNEQPSETHKTQQYVNMKEAHLLLNSLGLQNLDVQQKQTKRTITSYCEIEKELRQERLKRLKLRRNLRAKIASRSNSSSSRQSHHANHMAPTNTASLVSEKPSTKNMPLSSTGKRLSANFARDFHDLVFNATFRPSLYDTEQEQTKTEEIRVTPW